MYQFHWVDGNLIIHIVPSGWFYFNNDNVDPIIIKFEFLL